ncbi:beta-glucosidase BglX [Aliifodinibius sp. S!AR15-10]|uniref:beta-glucosidase BglX n=1 Tax=Aliifodinibius sp. S!AR15-10 TaxID=2950437 RepID=UPI0028583163|nr:beta-glucosidase BglX [Aliifodinibius sp. S!AR15-10]MDR8389805.1 beta-glucosidase BglX [Aliifodinibius sp. S!AR15-10]
MNAFKKILYPMVVIWTATLISASTPALGQHLTEQEINHKVDSLLSIMTLEEKVGQLTLFTSDMTSTGPTIRDNYLELVREGKVGALFNAFTVDYTRKLQKTAVEETRLGIPLLFGFDVIHGFRTIFPIPLGETASWDPELVREASRVAGREAAASGLHWTFAPMVDVTNDPRWGRTSEGSGEDPYLGSVMAAARTRGFQGDDLSDHQTVMATVKHFAAYGAPEGGRDYNTVNMSERRLREIYLPPFKAALDAGASTIMTAFNELNGVPATGNKFLMNKILHEEWDFSGFTVTDYTSIPEMITHGYAKDGRDAALKSIEANVDMDMQSGLYLEQLPELVRNEEIPEGYINRSVRRILEMKYRLGLFEDPYRYSDAGREKREILSEENRAKAREVARESIVLLKNENDLLPLPKEVEKLAVIGPLADSQEHLLGNWSGAGRAEDNVTVLQGIKNKVSGDTDVTYVKGADINSSSREGFDAAVKAARDAEVAVMVVGEAREMSGEASVRAHLDLPGVQQELLKAVKETGTTIVMVLMNGRPLAIEWEAQNIPAILETWFAGTEGGNAIADILFGDDNPSGKLPATFPRTMGMVPYHYNHKMTGRPFDPNNSYTSRYLDVENSALYPFGYGLSYTTFEYDNLSVSRDSIGVAGSVNVTVDVMNIGERTGEEVVQLYIRDLVGSVTRPVKELKGFEKIQLDPGETQTVSFNLGPEKLAFYNIDMEKVVEPGEFKVFVGGNSQDVLEGGFTVVD